MDRGRRQTGEFDENQNNFDRCVRLYIQIRTETGSGSIFSSTRAHVGIYRVDAQCRIEYAGTIDLDKPLVLVGLPSDSMSYLVIEPWPSHPDHDRAEPGPRVESEKVFATSRGLRV